MDKEKIRRELKKLDDSELLSLYREFLKAKQYFNKEIYDMSEFDRIMGNETPLEIVNHCYYGEFCPKHAYFTFIAYGNLLSSDRLTMLMDLDKFIDWLIDNNHEFLEDIK